MWPFSRKKETPAEKKAWIGNGSIYYSSVATWSDWNTEKAIREGFKSSVPVFACIKKRYDAITSLPLVVQTFQADEWTPQPNHPLQILLDNPNPQMSSSELLRFMMTHLDLGGNAYWHKVRGGQNGQPQELWPLAPYPVTVGLAGDGTVTYYQIGSRMMRYVQEDICHFMFVDPDNQYQGQAPLMAAGKAVDVDNSAQSFQKVSMQNRGVPDYVLSFDAELTEDQAKQAKDMITDRTGPGSAREPIVTSKATVKQLALTPVEMDFMQTRRFSREEVCSVYGVPSALIAEMGQVNLANSETARRLFWLDTVIPLMDDIVSVLNRSIAREYGNSNELRITYDTSNVAALQENYSEKVANAQKLWAMGVPFNTINQRLELGFDDIDNGDVGYISSGNIPTSYDFAPEPDQDAKKKVFDLLTKQASKSNIRSVK